MTSVECSKCKISKSPDDFYRSKTSLNGLRSQCKKCVLSAHKEWRETNKESFRQMNREANRRYYNSESGRANALKKNAQRYGLSVEEYNALLNKNGGVCPICNTRPATHIDHCHSTGAVRGALCSPCNTALGSFMDSPEILERAIKYLAAVSPLPDKE